MADSYNEIKWVMRKLETLPGLKMSKFMETIKYLLDKMSESASCFTCARTELLVIYDKYGSRDETIVDLLQKATNIGAMKKQYLSGILPAHHSISSYLKDEAAWPTANRISDEPDDTRLYTSCKDAALYLRTVASAATMASAHSEGVDFDWRIVKHDADHIMLAIDSNRSSTDASSAYYFETRVSELRKDGRADDKTMTVVITKADLGDLAEDGFSNVDEACTALERGMEERLTPYFGADGTSSIRIIATGKGLGARDTLVSQHLRLTVRSAWASKNERGYAALQTAFDYAEWAGGSGIAAARDIGACIEKVKVNVKDDPAFAPVSASANRLIAAFHDLEVSPPIVAKDDLLCIHPASLQCISRRKGAWKFQKGGHRVPDFNEYMVHQYLFKSELDKLWADVFTGGHIKNARQVVVTRQKEASRCASSLLVDEMRAAYLECAAISGQGMRTRIINVMQPALSTSLANVAAHMQELVMQCLEPFELSGCVEQTLSSLADSAARVAVSKKSETEQVVSVLKKHLQRSAKRARID
ncbi:hypothetical protein JKP88DRAFT_254572 [Tribonema minus]|uniref:Uncharacterized protein n=1 Tax=Tribonema minus TaxID=303371 RepID=A0A835Z1Z0_9STRA|nr:hypothetical protein JKP88DRAFT_254572 [Tribonema minus]